MCTVTFIPAGNKIHITHNRDEKSLRPKAIPPKHYSINRYKLLFPKDGQAGGTWIAANENGSAAVLLNGGLTKHTHQPPYKKSRGLVFLDIMVSEDLYLSYAALDLSNIEPFTVILWNRTHLFECRWDGRHKHIKELDAKMRHTWSSVTLYDAETVARRENWFEAWQLKHAEPSMNEIMQFHLFGGDGDVLNDLCMNRDGLTLTVSITALEITPDKCQMKYLDTQDNYSYIQEMIFTKAGVTK
jgi:Transport and Golgi organisation 2